MKTLLFTLLAMVTLVSCNCQKTATNESSLAAKESTMTASQNIPILEYEAMTRSNRKKIKIENGQIFIEEETRGKQTLNDNPNIKVLSTNDLKELASLYSRIDKANLENLEAPSKAHQYDGAPIANFSIKVGEKYYRTPSFDGGNPPAEIAEIVNKMIALAGIK